MKTHFEEISPHSKNELSRAPLIFLHGVLFSSKVWKTVAPMIANRTGRKAYLLDARNHGRSMWSDEMNFDVLTADLTEFMDDHNIKRAVIIGNSMGGRTAINFALKHPFRVEALVVEDMTPRNVKSGSRAFVRNFVDVALEQISTYPPEMDLEEMRRQVIDDLIVPLHPVYFDKRKVFKHLKTEVVPIVKVGNTFKPEANIDAIITMMESNFLVQDLPKKNKVFKGAALFIYGSKGFFNLGEDPTVKALFPRAIVRRVEGASHFIHIDSPEEYTKIVSEFILSGRDLSKY